MDYIRSIALRDIRGFHKLDLDLSTQTSKPRMRTLIIGKNGTLKSTLLRCIVLGLCDLEEGNSLLAEPIGQLISEGKDEGTITIEFQRVANKGKYFSVIRKIRRKGNKEILYVPQNMQSDPMELFVCGYGVGRSTEATIPFRPYRIIDSVYTMFQYEAGMETTELCIRRLKDYLKTKHYDVTMEGIKRAIGLGSGDIIELPRGGGVDVSGPSIGKKIPLNGLADGYRLSFAWVMDLYAHAMKANSITPEGGVRGILLIDELEQHLHPSMQTNRLQQLSDLFPELQIFATTHSPMVALGATPNELVVLRRKEKNVYAEEFVPDFTGYSAEDMLVDDRLFDSPVYSPDTNRKLSDYLTLKEIPPDERSPEQSMQLRKLATELSAQNLSEVRESPLAEELRRFREKYDL